MKFQDSSFNGLKVIVGTKKCDPRTHPCTLAPKAICPVNFFKVGGIMMTEGRKDGKTDRLKTVYPPKLRLRGV